MCPTDFDSIKQNILFQKMFKILGFICMSTQCACVHINYDTVVQWCSMTDISKREGETMAT